MQRRLLTPTIVLVAVISLLGWRFIWPERTLKIRVRQLDDSPALLVLLGTTGIFSREEIQQVIRVSGTPVIKAYDVQSETGRTLWVSKDRDGHYHAFAPFIPSSECPLIYEPTAKNFVEPCKGAVYSLAGEYLVGPGTLGLLAYPTQYVNGEIVIDLSAKPSVVAR